MSDEKSDTDPTTTGLSIHRRIPLHSYPVYHSFTFFSLSSLPPPPRRIGGPRRSGELPGGQHAASLRRARRHAEAIRRQRCSDELPGGARELRAAVHEAGTEPYAASRHHHAQVLGMFLSMGRSSTCGRRGGKGKVDLEMGTGTVTVGVLGRQCAWQAAGDLGHRKQTLGCVVAARARLSFMLIDIYVAIGIPRCCSRIFFRYCRHYIDVRECCR